MFDGFVTPGFSTNDLTLAINKVPYTPGVIGRLGVFNNPKRLTTTTVRVEVKGYRLALVPEMPRGAPPTPNVEDRRIIVPIEIPHFPIRDSIYADAVQNVRAFGTSNELVNIESVRDERLTSMGVKLDTTLEFCRLGAVKGKVITALDRVTGAPLIVRDLYRLFNVAPQPVIEWPIIGAGELGQEITVWSGQLTKLVNHISRAMAEEVPGGGMLPPSVHGVCGPTFFDAFVTHPERRAAYIAIDNAPLLNPQRGRQITFQDVTIEEYRGRMPNGVPFIEPDICHFFPIGVPDLFVEAYAPADYIEAVNTVALPRYAKSEEMEMGKGIILESQMNVFPFCSAPRCLFTVRATEWQPPANGSGNGGAGGGGAGNGGDVEGAALAATRTRRAA